MMDDFNDFVAPDEWGNPLEDCVKQPPDGDFFSSAIDIDDYLIDIDLERAMRKAKLPEPDQYGNYWLNAATRPSGPAILHTAQGTKARLPAGYIASTGEEILMKDQDFEVFDSPKAALTALLTRCPKVAEAISAE